MSFARPTLADLVARVQADFVSRLELTGAVLRRAMIYVLSRVIAGASHMLHGHLDWIFRQLFPDTSESTALVRQAAVFGIVKTPPTFATGTATIGGTMGTVVPAGTVLVRSDGAEYTVNANVTFMPATGETLALTSRLAGAVYSLVAGVVLKFQSPISGITSTAPVAATTLNGTDEETTEALRVRFLARLAEPPMGGSAADYIAWAKGVAGVTRAWVYSLELGAGTVVVRFVRDNDAGLIPDAPAVAAVQTAIDLVRPAHATVTVAAPVAAPITFTISVVPNTAAVKAAVSAKLVDLVLRASPGAAVLLSAIRTAIGTATGLTDYTLTLVNGLAPANVTNTTNQLSTLGAITWA